MFKLDRPQSGGPLAQGDIVADIVEYRVEAPAVVLEEVQSKPIRYRRVLVLTQSCDLQNDYKSRFYDKLVGLDQDYKDRPNKHLLSGILLCELQEESEFRNPDRGINRGVWNKAQENEQDKYHCLGPIENEDGNLYSLYADFRRIWVCPTEALYAAIEQDPHRRQGIVPYPYIDHFVQRFYGFHARLALPDPDNDIPDRET